MKVHAEVAFKAELTELTQEEAELIRDAVKLMATLEEEDAGDYRISKEQIKLASKMFPELQQKFRESNWRE